MRKSTKKKIRLAGVVLFMLYLILLIYFLFFAEWYGRASTEPGDIRYNLVPFLEIGRYWHHRHALGFQIVFLNLAGNIIGFIPFGFILPVMHRQFQRGWLVVICGFALSVFVECMQLLTRVGSCDVDDVILNTTGALLGYLMFMICNAVRRRIYGKRA